MTEVEEMESLKSPFGQLFLKIFSNWKINETSMKMNMENPSLTAMVVFQFENRFVDCRWNDRGWSIYEWDRNNPKDFPEPIFGNDNESLQSVLSHYIIEEIHHK